MRRLFVMTAEFDKQWKAMGCSDDDLSRLQRAILENPKIGAVMEGTGRLRKMRFAFEGRGKSGSARVTYADFTSYHTVYLVYAYPKSEKENLSKAERSAIKAMLERIEQALDRREIEKKRRHTDGHL